MRMVVFSAVLYGCRYQLNASAKDCMPTLISHASKFVAIASQVRKLTAQADAQVKTAAQRVVMPPVQISTFTCSHGRTPARAVSVLYPGEVGAIPPHWTSPPLHTVSAGLPAAQPVQVLQELTAEQASNQSAEGTPRKTPSEASVLNVAVRRLFR